MGKWYKQNSWRFRYQRSEHLNLGPLELGTDLSQNLGPHARLEAKTRKNTYQLHTHGPQLVPGLDARIEALPSNVRTQEPTCERVPRPVRIHDQLVRDRRHPKHPGFARCLPIDDDSRLGALCDHHDARTRGVGFAVPRDALGDLGDIRRVGFEHGLGVFLSFRFVPDDDVCVGKDLLQLGSEEFGDERCGEVEDERLRVYVFGIEEEMGGCTYLVVGGRVFAQREHRIDAMREEESLDVKHLGTLHERGNRRRREMRHVEFLSRAQRRHQRSNATQKGITSRVNDKMNARRQVLTDGDR